MIEDLTQMPLGRLPSPDPKDKEFPLRAALPRRLAAAYRKNPWKMGPVLDQGYTSSCVGHAWRAFLDAQPIRTKAGPDALTIYREAQRIDEWPGEEPTYEGTSTRAGVQVLEARGHVSQYLWAFDAQTVADYVRTRGVVVIGVPWLENMFFPMAEKNYILDVNGPEAGGHALVVRWFNKTTRLFTLRNSWGASWGLNGEAYMRFSDLERLLRMDGEACSGVERKVI